MDKGPGTETADPVVVTGLGAASGAPCDPRPFLRSRKTRKFMGTQDDLAVVAAGRALASAALDSTTRAENAGIYLAVGYIPFEQEDIDTLLDHSMEDGRFSMRRFSTDGYAAVNPLLTFRCLSNMPAFHISVNFDIRGPYFVTYPGPAQFYLALEEALCALDRGDITLAVVGGVAHQRNFLVAQHYGRLLPPHSIEKLGDAAGCLILEKARDAAARRAPERARLLHRRLAYRPFHPLEDAPPPRETLEGTEAPALDFGAASLPVALAGAQPGAVRHVLRSRDGFHAESTWEVP